MYAIIYNDNQPTFIPNPNDSFTIQPMDDFGSKTTFNRINPFSKDKAQLDKDRIDLGQEITIAGIPCRMEGWIDITQTTSFEKIAQLPAQNTIDLRFLSPTSFKQVKNVQPFPL